MPNAHGVLPLIWFAEEEFCGIGSDVAYPGEGKVMGGVEVLRVERVVPGHCRQENIGQESGKGQLPGAWRRGPEEQCLERVRGFTAVHSCLCCLDRSNLIGLQEWISLSFALPGLDQDCTRRSTGQQYGLLVFRLDNSYFCCFFNYSVG